jgi:D-alanyl-D-alanine dipeptidase
LALPPGFVWLDAVRPEIAFEARYASADNFMGRPVDGYGEPRIVVSDAVSEALARAALELSRDGLGLKVFDSYRPQRAVDHFVRWAGEESDISMKARHYPGVAKKDLIPGGYIAARSGHSRGAAVDLTLVSLEDGRELLMGTPFDFFGPESASEFPHPDPSVIANRARLRDAMIRAGFKPLKEEWWHFSLVEEPFPDRYFDFPIE